MVKDFQTIECFSIAWLFLTFTSIYMVGSMDTNIGTYISMIGNGWYDIGIIHVYDMSTNFNK